MGYTDYLEKLSMLPEHMRGAMQRYIERGLSPGSFLTAVLSNDLRESFSRADQINRNAMFDYIMYLYNYVPHGCWGDSDTVAAWIERGGLEGREDA